MYIYDINLLCHREQIYIDCTGPSHEDGQLYRMTTSVYILCRTVDLIHVMITAHKLRLLMFQARAINSIGSLVRFPSARCYIPHINLQADNDSYQTQRRNSICMALTED